MIRVVGGGWDWTPISRVHPSLLECGNPFVSISGDCALTRLRISEVAAGRPGFWGSVRSCRTPRWNRRLRLTWWWILQARRVCTCAPCLCDTFDYLFQVVLVGGFFYFMYFKKCIYIFGRIKIGFDSAVGVITYVVKFIWFHAIFYGTEESCHEWSRRHYSHNIWQELGDMTYNGEISSIEI